MVAMLRRGYYKLIASGYMVSVKGNFPQTTEYKGLIVTVHTYQTHQNQVNILA